MQQAQAHHCSTTLCPAAATDLEAPVSLHAARAEALERWKSNRVLVRQAGRWAARWLSGAPEQRALVIHTGAKFVSAQQVSMPVIQKCGQNVLTLVHSKLVIVI